MEMNIMKEVSGSLQNILIISGRKKKPNLV